MVTPTKDALLRSEQGRKDIIDTSFQRLILRKRVQGGIWRYDRREPPYTTIDLLILKEKMSSNENEYIYSSITLTWGGGCTLVRTGGRERVLGEKEEK